MLNKEYFSIFTGKVTLFQIGEFLPQLFVPGAELQSVALCFKKGAGVFFDKTGKQRILGQAGKQYGILRAVCRQEHVQALIDH